jgi:2-C-methyl-D-erythritol 4-phosphate cytidylyltransferase
MKADKNKQYWSLAVCQFWLIQLGEFHPIAEIEEVIIAAGKDELDFCRVHVAEKYGFTKVKKIVPEELPGRILFIMPFGSLPGCRVCDYS